MSNIHDYTEQFMRTAGQTVRTTPSVPTTDEMKLRLSLESEELREKAQAMGLERTYIGMLIDYVLKSLEKSDISKEDLGDFKRALVLINRFLPKDTGVVNLIEVFDAALDQNVVWAGTNLAFGFKDIMDEGDEEVWDSNMSKFDNNVIDAKKTVTKYLEQGEEVYQERVGSLIVTKRKGNNKILKSHKYRPTDLAPIMMGETDKTLADLTEASPEKPLK